MKRALFVILPYPSHYYACFSYARHLLDKGYQITFTGSPGVQDTIEREGFQFYELSYMTEYSIKSVKAALATMIQSWLNKKFVISRYRDFYQISLNIIDLCSIVQPDVVLFDEPIIEYAFFIKGNERTIYAINTRLSTKRVKGVPPLSSGFAANGGYVSNVICGLLWEIELIKRQASDFLHWICFLGKDEIYFWKRFVSRQNLDWSKEISREHCFYRTIQRIPTLIMAPKRFEYPWHILQSGETYFNGSMNKNEAEFMSADYYSLIDRIKTGRAEGKLKVVYAAFGTLNEIWAMEVLDFYRRLSLALRDESNVLLVISKRSSLGFIPDQENLKFLEIIPQVHFLQFVDVMICHGGLGSIKECLVADVPLYILPMNSKSDNRGNAARVKFHGLGVTGSLKKDSVKKIRNKVMKLLDKKSLRMRV